MRTKKILAQVCILLTIILIGTMAFPVYARKQEQETVTVIETASLSFVHEGIPVTAKWLDIFHGRQHFIKITAEVEFEGSTITIESEEYPIEKLLPKNTHYTSSLSTYYWDGIRFVRAPGSSTQWVKFDHPDNYNRYYRGQINRDYYLNGYSRTHHHVAQWRCEEAKRYADFGRISALLAGVIGILLAIPEIISKIAAAIVGLIAAIVGLVSYVLRWFIGDIIQDERGSGWVWTWGYGKLEFWGWVIAAWWWISFGSWRDWGFFVVI